MIEIEVIFFIIIVHWFGDFILQTDWQAKNKSKNNYALLSHVSTYSMVWLFGSTLLYLIFPNQKYELFVIIIPFTVITFLLHYWTDYVTSRIVKYLYQKGDNHNMFVVIGADQILHYVQLFLTYEFLFN